MKVKITLDNQVHYATLADNPILFPDDAIKRRLATWGGLPEAVETELEDRFTTISGG